MNPIVLLYPMRSYFVVSGTLEKPNVMVADWVMPVSLDPPMLAVSIAPSRYTHELIEERDEFVISVPRVEHVDDLRIAGTRSGRRVDKSKLLKLTFVPSKRISVPSLKECLANLECKVAGKYPHGDHTIFVGEIVDFTYDQEAFEGGSARVDRVEFIMHTWGEFVTTKGRRIG